MEECIVSKMNKLNNSSVGANNVDVSSNRVCGQCLSGFTYICCLYD